jgi:cell shape-determining protein MreC
MKRQFFRKANSSYVRRQGSLTSTSGLLPAAICIVVIGVLFIFRAVVPGAFYTVFTPVLLTGSSLTASLGSAFYTSSEQAALTERDSLRLQLDTVQNQNAVLTAKVQDLTTLLGTQTAPAKGIIASVLARPPVSAYDTLLLSAGSNGGVVMGVLVRAQGGIPIGHITEVTTKNSRVTLFSQPGIATAGYAGANRLPVSLTGEGAGAISATIPRDEGLQVGDGIYVSAAGGEPIGTITNIETDPSSPNAVLHIQPYVNPFSVTSVSIQSGT